MATKKGKIQRPVTKTNTAVNKREERSVLRTAPEPFPAPAPYVPLLKKYITQGESYIGEFEGNYGAFAPYISDFRRHKETMEYLQGELAACTKLQAEEAEELYKALHESRYIEQKEDVQSRIKLAAEANFADKKQALEDALKSEVLVALSDNAYDAHQPQGTPGKMEKPELLIDQFLNSYRKEINAFNESQDKVKKSVEAVLASKGKLDDIFGDLVTYTTSNPKEETLKGLRNAIGYDGLTEAIATQTETELNKYYALAEKMTAKIRRLKTYPLPGYELKKPAEPATGIKAETSTKEATLEKTETDDKRIIPTESVAEETKGSIFEDIIGEL